MELPPPDPKPTPSPPPRPPSDDGYARIKDISAQLPVISKFRSCSDRLDDRATRDLDRVIRELTKPQYRGRAVYVLGFADSVGSMELNEALSRFRGETVKIELEARGVEKLESKAFGEKYAIVKGENQYAPAARADDRRVEIWIQKGVVAQIP
jgi:phosphate transport system substrate-binding protein